MKPSFDWFQIYAIKLNKTAFLNLGTLDILRWGGEDCPGRGRMLSSVPNNYPLDARGLCPTL